MEVTGVPDAELIAYYDFEDDTQDESGNANHGTNNGVTFSTTVASALSHSSKSGSFEGGGDHVDLGYLGIFNTTQTTDVSISFWVRPNVASQAAWIGFRFHRWRAGFVQPQLPSDRNPNAADSPGHAGHRRSAAQCDQPGRWHDPGALGASLTATFNEPIQPGSDSSP